MATRVLILNRQLAFAVKIKQALEQTGLFDVHPFTKADSAFDFLREHPQDIALVDFTLPGRSGAKIVQQLRGIQPDLAVVISPRQPPADVESLNLQGMIDAPFSARDIIPVIESALSAGSVQAQPTVPQTRLFPDDTALDQSRLTTGGLEEISARDHFGATQHFGESTDDEPDKPQTRILGGEPQTDTLPEDDEPDRPPTRLLDGAPRYEEMPPSDDVADYPPDGEVSNPPFGHTRTLSPEELTTPKLPPTRMLEEPPAPPAQSPARQIGKTRKFETSEESVSDLFASRSVENPPPPPEISSLDEVLKSFGGFEGFDTPPVEEEDTPAVPMQDSDAVRQYLATTSPEIGGNFDNVLDAIDPETLELSKRQTDEFQGLVRSLTHSEPHTPLPGRQQQTMDFILTTGMDSVLQEIEKTKTGIEPVLKPDTLPEEKEKRKPTSFQKITEEEPPMPTLEESGTVSDLLVGISDRGFRNVLSLLRGDELEDSEASSQVAPTQQDMDEAFRDFFGSSRQLPPKPPETGAAPAYEPSSDEEVEEAPHAFSFDNFPEEPPVDEDATVAGVVLQSTLDESQFPAGFSVDRLIADIEDRLAAHRLNIRPLPSWDMDTTAFRAIVDQAEIREPSFLPEELPPGELVAPDEQATRLSAAIRQGLDAIPIQPDELSQTRPSEPVQVQPSPEAPLMQDFQPPWANEPAQNEGSAVQASWLEEPAESLPEMGEMPAFEDLPPQPEFENPPVASEYPAGFGIDHMFDDLLASIETEVEPVEDEAWGDQENASETARPVSPLDEYITPEERSAAAAALPATWIDEPGETDLNGVPEEAAVEPGWLTEDYPETTAEVEEELSEQPNLSQPAHPLIDIWNTPPVEAEETIPEQDAVASIDWGEPQATPDYDEAEEAEPEESPVASIDWDMPETTQAEEVEPEHPSFAASDWDLPQSTSAPVEAPVPALQLSPEEAYIAQLALNLTQVSLELSSEGSILTRGTEIVAFAGHLSQMDALELRNVINNDWSVGDEGARLRFISLPSSGKDYMLYSIRTVDDLVLSMIFAGTTPLRVIRQQGQRLLQALESTPAVLVEEPPPPAPVAPTAPAAITPVAPSAPPLALDDYAYVWLVRNPEQHLSDAVSHAISTGLTTQLNEMRWKIQSLEVDEHYVYLLASVPDDLLPNQVIGDLQRRSAEIASAQDQSLSPQTLWADSYLVLTPGREMSHDEIQEFIDFQRMM